ncbi:MAG: PAS domain S-box protein [Methyloversatilis sp.]|jgi:PAS domain S-box-containing protein|nr:PAS domain S-box protein [Methyloversatilis sp.]MBP6193246.1 PAS domain S-box protein [Methyloversatilis sp.]MBP9117921.1 PAS domain S-box protein [Methyloversatilis sp.]
MEERRGPLAPAARRLRTPAWLGELWRGTALAAGLLVIFYLVLSGLRSMTDPSALHASLSPEIARLLAAGQGARIEALLSQTYGSGRITNATVLDGQGALVVRIGLESGLKDASQIRVEGPLMLRSAPMGWLSLGSQRADDSASLAMLLASGGLAAFSVLLIWGTRCQFRRRMTRPVRELAQAARALPETGSLELPGLSREHVLAPIAQALAAAEEALARSRAELESQLQRMTRVARSHDEAEWEWLLDSGETWYNARFPTLVGHSDDTSFRQQFNWSAATHPDDASTIRLTRQRLVSREIERSDDQIRLRTRDGTYRWFRLRGAAEHDVTGHAVRLSGTLEDVTRERMTLDALRESEARLFHAVRGSFDGAWDWDIGAGRYFLSPRLSELLGLPQSMQPQTHDQLLERVHPEDLTRLNHAIDEHFLRRESFDIEYRMRHEHGHYLWVRDRGLATRSSQGKVLRFSGSITDITERKRAERAMHALAAEKQALLDDVPVAIVYVRDGTIADCNRRCDEIFGYRRSDLIGQTVQRFFASDVDLTALLEGAIRSMPQPHAQEVMLQRVDGSVLHAYVSVRQLEQDALPASDTIWIFSDDTARRRALDTARREEHFSAALVRSMPGVFFLLDSNGLLRRWNENLQAITDSTSTSLIGKPALDFFPAPAHARLRRKARRALTQRTASFEAELLSGGEPLVHAFSLYRIDLDGLPHLLGTGLDIRAQKEAEQSMVALNQRLETRVKERTAELLTAMRELESFSYSVSHDLAAPLRGIDGFSRMIEEDYADKLDERGRDYLQRIRLATQRMHCLIDDLLGLARITRNEMHRRIVDVSALAQDVAAELTRGEPARQVEFSIDEGLRVYADASLFRIVIDNLLRNAWKFTSRHTVARIEVGCLKRGRELVYFVRDDGAGFDMRYANKLFGPFQRLHSVGDFAGSGIGLAIVHRIVQRHGGRIWAEAEVERGACFYFTLEPASS